MGARQGRACFFSVSPGEYCNEFTWSAEDVIQADNAFRKWDPDLFPWLTERLGHGELVLIPDTTQMPSEASAECDFLVSHNIAGAIWIPMVTNGTLSGQMIFEFASPQSPWIQPQLELLSRAGDIIEKGFSRYRQERDLTGNQELFQSLVESDLFSLFVCELPTSRLLYANPRACIQMGYEPEEVCELTLSQLVDAQDHDTLERCIREHSQRHTGMTSTYAYTVVRKDGLKFRCDISAKVVEYRGQQALMGILVDSTEKERLMRQLQQAQKMEAIGTLAGGIAHDFNNILGSILGYSEIAQMHSAKNDKVQPFLDRVIQAALRAKDLVTQILAFSRKSDQEKKAIHLAPLVKEILKLLRASLPATIEIVQDIHLSIDMINADATQIHQVLMNLCTNAAHAMEKDGGTLEIGLSNYSITPAMAATHPDLSPGVYVKLVVKDTGHGIDSGIRERIFEPYFTTKDKGKGTGLGLAVVHGIVASHGGSIDCISERGKGARFEVLFPAEKDAALYPDDEMIEKLARGSEHILVVDDEKFLTDMVAYILENLGYRVTVCNEASEALERFSNSPQEFDILLTDMTMPVMTGKELAAKMLKIRPHFPVILCTGYSKWINEEEAVAMGIQGYLPKPFTLQSLTSMVRGLLDNTHP